MNMGSTCTLVEASGLLGLKVYKIQGSHSLADFRIAGFWEELPGIGGGM